MCSVTIILGGLPPTVDIVLLKVNETKSDVLILVKGKTEFKDDLFGDSSRGANEVIGDFEAKDEQSNEDCDDDDVE